ncbi:glucuronate isomerase [Thermoactinomyces mirandus]|uniref:Uronate isomerase n=1 Tax=Thermoactinomyces mirandus TaxID=2756294 RepID=A0A7W1XPQ1_9BACL|nr:glucuronate isomerase [Thermoactinomyces mirandus]MBA4600999.1 glucuronate isomerase [Thermoactinomyces mirandus]
MKAFMDKDFLLQTETAKRLYHDYAAKMPIYDYHCHLSPQEICENRTYRNMTELWLEGDHYKWRAMRANGIDESYISGDADDCRKFEKWAETVEKLIGNPLYHWTHMELRKYFHVDTILKKETAREIWDICNQKLQDPDFSARGLIERSNVRLICTTDDPIDDLRYHQLLKNEKDFSTMVLPSFRPDKVIAIQNRDWTDYIEKLGKITGIQISDFARLMDALEKRMDYFAEVGCKLSDHSLENVVYEDATASEIDAIVEKALNRKPISVREQNRFLTQLLVHLGKAYSQRGWVMQYHIGALRSANIRLFRALGPNVGCDSMKDNPIAVPLSRLLDAMDQERQLPKTILYCLNPRDNEMLAAMAGNFQEGGTPSKVQFGAAWWFNDHIDGMTAQIKTLGNLGLLSRFVGMLTDSRSFLSYSRHEYFRRILCNLLGEWVENGEYPHDLEWLGKIVQDISYNNASRYFDFELK